MLSLAPAPACQFVEQGGAEALHGWHALPRVRLPNCAASDRSTAVRRRGQYRARLALAWFENRSAAGWVPAARHNHGRWNDRCVFSWRCVRSGDGEVDVTQSRAIPASHRHANLHKTDMHSASGITTHAHPLLHRGRSEQGCCNTLLDVENLLVQVQHEADEATANAMEQSMTPSMKQTEDASSLAARHGTGNAAMIC